MITKEELLEFGMEEVPEESAAPFIMEKPLAPPGEKERFIIGVTTMYNTPEIAIELPMMGGTIYLGGVETIDELRAIEKGISRYEPGF
jgi:hypothetical protein